MDIWVAVKADNAERIVSALREFGFAGAELSTTLFLQENRIVRLGTPPMRIEILTGVSGVTFDDCYSQRVSDVINGVPVNIINLQDLKLNKKASGCIWAGIFRNLIAQFCCLPSRTHSINKARPALSALVTPDRSMDLGTSTAF